MKKYEYMLTFRANEKTKKAIKYLMKHKKMKFSELMRFLIGKEYLLSRGAIK